MIIEFLKGNRFNPVQILVSSWSEFLLCHTKMTSVSLILWQRDYFIFSNNYCKPPWRIASAFHCHHHTSIYICTCDVRDTCFHGCFLRSSWMNRWSEAWQTYHVQYHQCIFIYIHCISYLKREFSHVSLQLPSVQTVCAVTVKLNGNVNLGRQSWTALRYSLPHYIKIIIFPTLARNIGTGYKLCTMEFFQYKHNSQGCVLVL